LQKKRVRKMDIRTVKVSKEPCQECLGNGFVRVPYHLAKEEIWVDCTACTKGEVQKEKWEVVPQQ